VGIEHGAGAQGCGQKKAGTSADDDDEAAVNFISISKMRKIGVVRSRTRRKSTRLCL
jgi:hypothetical protein